jgi:hypothetical protein
MPKSDLVRPDRRHVILGSAALAGAAAWPGALVASQTGLAPANDLLAATKKFAATLEPAKLQAAAFPWNGQEWRSWNYFGASGYTKPGLRLEQMNTTEKAAAWDLLAVMWSKSGLEKARNVMLLQEVLAQSGDAPTQRSPERFSFSIFGPPVEKGAWGLRFEGHHLTQSIAIRDNHIVSVTPFSFSVRPARISSGKYAGLQTIKNEEQLARKLFGGLSATQQGRARIGDTSPFNILSYAGRERANAKKAGLAAADLTTAQRDLLWQLIETYTVDHLPAALTQAQRSRIRSGDQAAVHFAWYGANTPDKSFGYRLIGDSFVIELMSVDPEAQHLHTIYHDMENVLGRT